MTQDFTVATGRTLHAAERSVNAASVRRGAWSGEGRSFHEPSSMLRASHASSARMIIGSVGIVTAIWPGNRTSTFGGTVIQTMAHATSGKRNARRKKAIPAAAAAARKG